MPLSHSFGALPERNLSVRLHAHQAQQFVHARLALFLAVAEQPGIEVEQVLAVEDVVEIGVFREKAELRPHRQIADMPLPKMVVPPLVGKIRPRTIFSVVVLPDPLGPTIE